jgi:Tfp pilus assembly protein FimT
MTLLEILLTLCLLVVLASLTWPSLGRPMAAQRLRESADQVRVEWVRARVHAMSTGQPHVFRYAGNGNAYVVDVQETDDDSDSASSASSDKKSDATTDAGGDLGTDQETRQQRLPERVRFVSDQAGSPSASQPAATSTQTSAVDDADLSQAIVFYPDGTCSDATLRLENEYNQTIELSLRGLTGVVLVSQFGSGETSGP